MPDEAKPSESIWAKPIEFPLWLLRGQARHSRPLALGMGTLVWALVFGVANVHDIGFLQTYAISLTWFAAVVVLGAILVAGLVRRVIGSGVSAAPLLLACYVGGVLYRGAMILPPLGVEPTAIAFSVASLLVGMGATLGQNLAVFAQQILLPFAVVIMAQRLSSHHPPLWLRHMANKRINSTP